MRIHVVINKTKITNNYRSRMNKFIWSNNYMVFIKMQSDCYSINKNIIKVNHRCFYIIQFYLTIVINNR